MPFQPIASQKIAQAIVQQLETLILKGVLRPGERLPAERDLAATLDVSRPTLREALSDLEARGLISIRRGGGARVADVLGSAFSPALIELFATHELALNDYLEFRRDLEGLAAERAALRATPSDREIINSVVERMLDAHEKRDPREEASIDAEFHMAVVEAAHNSVLLHMMRSIYELLHRGVFYNRKILYDMRESRDALLNQHLAIRDAVLSGDPQAAREAVNVHLDYVAASLKQAQIVRDREEIARLRLEQEERARAQAKTAAREVGKT